MFLQSTDIQTSHFFQVTQIQFVLTGEINKILSFYFLIPYSEVNKFCVLIILKKKRLEEGQGTQYGPNITLNNNFYLRSHQAMECEGFSDVSYFWTVVTFRWHVYWFTSPFPICTSRF